MRCGECGKPICPDCMYHGPVGVRCAECYGQVPGGPKVSGREYGLTAAAAAPTALLLGLAVGLLNVSGLIWSALAGIACGIAAGAVARRATNKGLAVGLQALVGMLVVFGIFAGGLLAAAIRAASDQGGFGAALNAVVGNYGVLDWGVTAFFATAAAVYWLRR